MLARPSQDMCNAAVRLSACALVLGLLCGCSAGAQKPAGNARTLQYVLASFDYLFYQTVGAKEECPTGFTPNSRQEWEAAFPTDAARQAQLTRCLAINNRGPNCENIWAVPDAVKDPLPYKPVTGRIAFGANLDGTADGHATPLTCPHEKFTSPAGETGIDNQYYRFFGCERFVQGGQHHAPSIDAKRTAQYQSARVLLEITDVDSQTDDPSVAVTLYRGRDPLAVDGQGNAVAWQTQRIDPSLPPLHLHGRIVKGELITDPVDVFWEGVLFDRRQLIRGLTLHLKLDHDKADGMRLGYVDVDRLWQSYSRTAKWGGQIYGSSGPAAYVAMHALADGYKNPRTGQCTALSSAERLQFIRAYIAPPANESTVF